MQFYIYLNGVRRGPLDEARVEALLGEGVLVGSDLVAESPDGPWKAVSGYMRFAVERATLVEQESAALAPISIPARVIPPAQNSVSETTFARTEGLVPLAPEQLGPYARSTLAPDEKAFHKTSLHWIIFARFAGVALLAFLFIALPFAIAVQALTGSQIGWFALPLPAFIMLPPTLAFASSELVVTDRRVLIKTGVVQRQTLEMFIARVESVGVDQGFFGRMFDYGTVSIRGTGGSEEPFEAIAHPLEFRNAVQRLQSPRG